jgi:two-component system, OmpR family, copper resistance phosphate regulon response regulator CusR
MHVLYIEDEVKTVQSVRQGLEEHQISMDFAYDGETGLLLARQSAYDVVICDVILPGMNGFDLVTRLREFGLRTPVLMLTALTATDHKVTGLESGADDYLVKPFAFQELLARIRALSRRSTENPYASSRLSCGDVVMNLDSRICTREGLPLDLTPREFELLAFFIRNQGRVISKKEIAEQVWGLDFDTGTNVVEVYVNYLRNKLDRPFDQKLIHTVFGVGYVLKR